MQRDYALGRTFEEYAVMISYRSAETRTSSSAKSRSQVRSHWPASSRTCSRSASCTVASGAGIVAVSSPRNIRSLGRIVFGSPQMETRSAASERLSNLHLLLVSSDSASSSLEVKRPVIPIPTIEPAKTMPTNYYAPMTSARQRRPAVATNAAISPAAWHCSTGWPQELPDQNCRKYRLGSVGSRVVLSQ